MGRQSLKTVELRTETVRYRRVFLSHLIFPHVGKDISADFNRLIIILGRFITFLILSVPISKVRRAERGNSY